MDPSTVCEVSSAPPGLPATSAYSLTSAESPGAPTTLILFHISRRSQPVALASRIFYAAAVFAAAFPTGCIVEPTRFPSYPRITEKKRQPRECHQPKHRRIAYG